MLLFCKKTHLTRNPKWAKLQMWTRYFSGNSPMKSSAELPAALKAMKTLQLLQKQQLICNTDKHYSLFATKMRKLHRKWSLRLGNKFFQMFYQSARSERLHSQLIIALFLLETTTKWPTVGAKMNSLYCSLFPILLSWKISHEQGIFTFIEPIQVFQNHTETSISKFAIINKVYISFLSFLLLGQREH